MKENLKQFTIHIDSNVEDALLLIEENGHRSLIIVDDDDVVQGIVSDGDIRKAIIGRHLLNTPVRHVMSCSFMSIRDNDRGSEAELFRKHPYIILLPVVDDQQKLVDVVTSY